MLWDEIFESSLGGYELAQSFGETAKYSIKHFSLEESLYAKSDTAKYPS